MKLGLKRGERECTKIWVLREAESAKESASVSGDYVTTAATNGRNGRLPETSLCTSNFSDSTRILTTASQPLPLAPARLPPLPGKKVLFFSLPNLRVADHWPSSCPRSSLLPRCDTGQL